MSSRSIGVTEVLLSRWMMSWVIRSPSCSQIRMSRPRPPASGHCLISCTSSSAERRMFAPASSKRLKNSRSLGTRLSLAMCALAKGADPPSVLVHATRAGRLLILVFAGFVRIEPVSDTEMRVDVAPAGRRVLELAPQFADEHVHGAVAVRHLVAPHPLVDPLARDHPPLRRGQQLQQLELAAGEAEGPPADKRLEHVRPD